MNVTYRKHRLSVRTPDGLPPPFNTGIRVLPTVNYELSPSPVQPKNLIYLRELCTHTDTMHTQDGEGAF